MREIVIVGAGYAGVLCANRLRASLSAEEARGVRIRIVNPAPGFVERIRLHELAAGTRTSATIPLTDLLHPDVELVVGAAVHIDPSRKVLDVRSDDGPIALDYDRLVYAVGSGGSTGRVPGAARFAYAIADPGPAAAAAATIAAGRPGQRIVVVGGGFTGVETAAEVAERRPMTRVTLVTSGPLVPAMRPRARRGIRSRLTRLGVTVEERDRVEAVDEAVLRFADGTSLPFDVCLWTASFSVPDLAATSGLACDAIGRLRVDEHLRSIDAPDILGAGDAVRLPDSVGGHLRMGCAIALPLGGAAALTLVAELRGEPLPVASVGFLVQCLSLGRRDGYVQVVRADDTATALALTGRLGARFKEAICRMTVDATKKERDRPGAYWGPKGPKGPAISPQREPVHR